MHFCSTLWNVEHCFAVKICLLDFDFFLSNLSEFGHICVRPVWFDSFFTWCAWLERRVGVRGRQSWVGRNNRNIRTGSWSTRLWLRHHKGVVTIWHCWQDIHFHRGGLLDTRRRVFIDNWISMGVILMWLTIWRNLLSFRNPFFIYIWTLDMFFSLFKITLKRWVLVIGTQ